MPAALGKTGCPDFSQQAGSPPLGSVSGFLLWQASRQPATLIGGVAFGVLWMLCQALWPYILGRAVDVATAGVGGALLTWCGILLVLAIVQSLAGMMRHRMAVSNWLSSSLGIARLIGHHSADTGTAITATTASGEIVATVSSDALRMGEMFDVTARLSGGLVAYLVVAFILLNSSLELGLAVLIGIPTVGLILSLLIRPLRARQAAWRQETGLLSTLGADTVVGLRVLRGIGGEREFVDRYARRSQAVRDAGVQVARIQSWLDGLQVLLPGILLAFVVWYGAHSVLVGRISIGQLVSFYGYATFLVLPLRTGVEAVQTFTRGLVAARRVLHVLRIRPAAADPVEPNSPPPPGAQLVDVTSGLTIPAGLLTAIVDPDPDAAAAVATRLGRFDDAEHRDSPVLWGGVDHTSVPVAAVRNRIVVSDASPHLFGGPLLDGLDVLSAGNRNQESTATGRIRRVSRALQAAAASEIIDGLPEGLHEYVPERGRSFSGGQRQRLSLARALLTEAEVLVLIEPTSAVDSHTEAQIAERVQTLRAGQTTVVVSTSPLLLDRADRVVVMKGGKVLGDGRHAELLRREDEVGALYRSVVARSTSSAEPERDADLDAAWTGAIDTLWSGAVETGAIPVIPVIPAPESAPQQSAASTAESGTPPDNDTGSAGA